jgi:hypothetical protein
MTRNINLITQRVRNTTLPRSAEDWEAYLNPFFQGDPIGFGPSEADAVYNLFACITDREAEDEEIYRAATS